MIKTEFEWIEQAQGYIEKKDFVQAKIAFLEALKFNPNNTTIHNNLANVFVHLKEPESAKQHLHQVLRLDPNHAESYNNFGLLLYKQSLYIEALCYFEKAIRLQNNYWEAHYNLSHCLTKLNQTHRATIHYQEVIKILPDHANAHFNLGLLKFELQEYEAAKNHLEIAFNVDPQNATAAEFIGHACLQLGERFQYEALEAFTKALKLNPHSGMIHHNLAVLYLGFKNREKALYHFKEALHYQPDNETAQHMYKALSGEAAEFAPSDYVRSLFDQYAAYYNQHTKEKLHYQVPHLLRSAISKVLGDNLKTGRVLDLGCGTGLCGIFFRDLAFELVGIDLSSKMLDKARDLGVYDEILEKDIIEYLSQENLNEFDLIIAADVLVYFGNLENVFRLVSKNLSREGLFAFTVEALIVNENLENLKNNQYHNPLNYKLNTNGRYAHDPLYIEALAPQFQFEILLQETITPRENEGVKVKGLLFVCRNLKVA